MCPNRTVVIEASSLLRLPPSQQLWQTARLCTGKSPETENMAPPICSSTGEASEADLWLRPRQCVCLPHRKCQLSKGYPHTEKSLFPNLQVKCIFFSILIDPPPPPASYQPSFSSASRRIRIGLFTSIFELLFHEDGTALQNSKTHLLEGQAPQPLPYWGGLALFCFALGFECFVWSFKQ